MHESASTSVACLDYVAAEPEVPADSCMIDPDCTEGIGLCEGYVAGDPGVPGSCGELAGTSCVKEVLIPRLTAGYETAFYVCK